MTDRMKPAWQMARSVEADFEKNTWTFEMSGAYSVYAGDFAIVRYEDFSRMNMDLAHAKGLLRRVLSEEAKLDDSLKEHVEAYFDPEPL
jgi:hypothetical protein